MSHAATTTSRYTLTMSWRAAGLRLVKWFAIAAGGQLLALAAFHQNGIFGLGEDDWKLIANAGVIAGLGWAVDFLSPKTGAPAQPFGVTRNDPPTPPEDGTP